MKPYNLLQRSITFFVYILPIIILALVLGHRGASGAIVYTSTLPRSADALPCRHLSSSDYSCTVPLSVPSYSATATKWIVTFPPPQARSKPAYHKQTKQVIRDLSQFSKKQTLIIESIVEIAKQLNYEDPGYLLALADCESSFGEAMRNSKGNHPRHSVDRGFYMFNDHWHPDVSTACADNLACATKMAIKKHSTGTKWACDAIIKKDGRLAFYRSKF